MLHDHSKKYNELTEKMKELGMNIPDTMNGFSELHRASISEGALSSKIKELIALGIAITVRCDGCIAYHVHDSIKAGARAEEIMETIRVAILMGGSLVTIRNLRTT